MKTSPRSTDELLLFLADAPRFDDALDALSGDFHAPSFPDYLAALMRRRKLSLPELGSMAQLSRSFMYQIKSGERSPSRDIVLRLSLVLGASVEDAQRLLRAAGRGKLYPKVRRDAAVLYALMHRVPLAETDALLVSLGETPLLK